MVPPASRPISRVGRYSGTPLASVHGVRVPGSHRLRRPVPRDFRSRLADRPWVLQPRPGEPARFRLRPFRSPLLRASRLISLPPGTEMFQFPGFASLLPVMTDASARRVSPFGHLGITACVPLPRAYRSLPRPSSPLCAQASPTYPRSLDHSTVIKQSTRDLLTSDTILPYLVDILSPRSLPPSVVKQRTS